MRIASAEMEDELCRRWYQLGALYPLARNHHFPSPFPNPDYWPQPTDIARKFIRLRYRLLPYLYTLFHGAHMTGSPVWRPLWYEFPRDTKKSAEIEGQFMLGPSILVTPILMPGITFTHAYFPPGVWYGLEDGLRIRSRGEIRVLGARADSIPLHIRGGSVLVTQGAEDDTLFTTTVASRRLDYQLLIGLDDRGMAQGKLYLDDGETPLSDPQESDHQHGELRFMVVDSQVLSLMGHWKGGWMAEGRLTSIVIFGGGEEGSWGGETGLGDGRIRRVILNGLPLTGANVQVEPGVVRLTKLRVSLNSPFTMTWSG